MEPQETKKYPRDKYVIPGLSMKDHLIQLREMKEWLARKGVKLAASRISHYEKFLEKYISLEQLDPHNNDKDKEIFDDLLYVLREIHELLWIYNGFKRSEPKGSEALFEKALGGRNFARDDKDTTARNHQLELRIASYFVRANYVVDMQRITDVIAKKSSYTFYIECKRIYSPKKVSARVSEAADQLNKRTKKRGISCRNLGIAVFDVTKLAFPHQGITFGMTYDHCREIIQHKLKEIRSKYDFTSKFSKNKSVVLVWLQIHIPSLHVLNAHPTTRFSSLLISLAPDSGYRLKAFNLLREAIEVPPYEL